MSSTTPHHPQGVLWCVCDTLTWGMMLLVKSAFARIFAYTRLKLMLVIYFYVRP